MKLLRPLHRQRTRRRTPFTVLGNEDLAAYHCVQLADLEAFMLRKGLAFHKDSCGNMWASCLREPDRAGRHVLPARRDYSDSARGLF